MDMGDPFPSLPELPQPCTFPKPGQQKPGIIRAMRGSWLGCPGPKLRERGGGEGRQQGRGKKKRHQADKFIFAISPFLFVCSDAAPGICTNQMEEAAISRKKKGGGVETGGREEAEAEGRRPGLFALKPQAERYPPQPRPALPDRVPIQERAGPRAGVRWGRGEERQRKFN